MKILQKRKITTGVSIYTCEDGNTYTTCGTSPREVYDIAHPAHNVYLPMRARVNDERFPSCHINVVGDELTIISTASQV
jgi:hypothetical protein